MSKEEIGLLIIIILVFLMLMVVIIVKGVNKNLNFLNNNKQYLPEQKDYVKVIKKEKIEIPKKFYSYTYSYIVTFKLIDTGTILDLYVEEYDADILDLDGEYKINHDGVVLFEYHESLLS